MHTREQLVRLVVTLVLVSALAFGALSLSARPARAAADTVPWSPARQITSPPPNSDYSTVVTDGQGHFYVFYEQNGGVGYTNVSVQKWTTNGGLNQPTPVFARQVTSGVTSVNTVAYPSHLSAAIDHSGNLYVAWTKASGYTGGHGADVYVSKSADGGDTWGAPVLANSVTGLGDDSNPSIAVSPNGTVYVAWTQSWNGWNNISVAFSTTAGVSFTGTTNVTTNTGRFYAVQMPDLVVDPSGRIYLAYDSQNAAAVYSVYLIYSDNGVDWSAPALLSNGQAFAYYPTVAMDPRGRVNVAWWDNRFIPSGFSVWFRQSPDRGASWSPSLLLSTSGTSVNLPDTLSATVKGSTVMVVCDGYAGGHGVFSWAVSTDSGMTFFKDQARDFTVNTVHIASAVDENGTVWASFTQ